jgi:hypothetical protein
MRNIFTSRVRYTAASITFRVATAGILTVMAGAVFVKGYEDCQESFENHPWAKDNPLSYTTQESSDPIRTFLGLKKFNVKATLDTIVKLEDETYGMALCVNAEIIRENKTLPEPNGVK